MEIIGHFQSYEWGKIGKDSLVAQIMCNNTDLKIDDQSPYAELWMGIHNNGESIVKDKQQPLSSWLRDNVKAGGPKIENLLPFLFKVLSVNKALSIQCHPNKVSLLLFIIHCINFLCFFCFGHYIFASLNFKRALSIRKTFNKTLFFF